MWQALLWLLEQVFWVLVAAALLRAWMNRLRLSLVQAPGGLAMALTDWLVKPLRRHLPAVLRQSPWDVASVLAAVVLLCLYAVLRGAVWWAAGWGAPSLLGFAAWAGGLWLRVVLQGLSILLLAYGVLGWFQPQTALLYGVLSRLLEPLLQPLRRWVPAVGGWDLSLCLLLLCLQALLLAFSV